jgi:hypothetical protein
MIKIIINYRLLIKSLLIIIVCLVGLIIPLYEFVNLDSDSVGYINRSIIDSIKMGYVNWGIYRSLAIVVKSILLSMFDFESNILVATTLFAISAKLIFLIALFNFTKTSYKYFPCVMAASICNIFFIDIALILSRSINDFIGSLLAALFLYICGKERVQGKALFLVSFLFVFLGLIGYESYIIFAFPIVIVFKKHQYINLICGFVFSVLLISFMHVNGIYLNHPKIINGPVSSVNQSLHIGNFLIGKAVQFHTTIQTIQPLEIGYSCIMGVILFRLIRVSYIQKNYFLANSGVVTKKRTISRGLFVALAGFLPIFLVFLTSKVGPHESKIQWLLIGGPIWMTVFGFIITESKKINIFAVVRVSLSLLFLASILLTIQLAKGLKHHDIEYLDNSIFRNLPIVQFNKKI